MFINEYKSKGYKDIITMDANEAAEAGCHAAYHKSHPDRTQGKVQHLVGRDLEIPNIPTSPSDTPVPHVTVG